MNSIGFKLKLFNNCNYLKKTMFYDNKKKTERYKNKKIKIVN